MTFCLYSIKFIPGHISFSMCHVNTLFATYAIYLISNWLLVEIKGKYYHTNYHTHSTHTENTRENMTWSQDFVWNKQCSEINTFYNFQALSKSQLSKFEVKKLNLDQITRTKMILTINLLIDSNEVKI